MKLAGERLTAQNPGFEDVYALCRTRLMMFSMAQLILQSSEMFQIEPLARRVTGLCRHTFSRKLVCLFHL